MTDFDDVFGLLDMGAKLEQEIVSIDTWANSHLYNTHWAKALYPYWKDQMKIFFEGNYDEIIVTGGLGSGKSIFGSQVLLRYLYELACHDFPATLCGLAKTSRLFFGYLSVTINQAKISGFEDFVRMIDGNEWFTKNCSRDSEINSMVRLPKKAMMVVPGSDAIHVIGTNLLTCTLDETNFYRRGGQASSGDIEKATSIYLDTTDRRRSRFEGKNIKYKGFSILISSATVTTSFTESRIKKADSRTLVTHAPTWATKPEKYSDEVFYVFSGSNFIEPQIVDAPTQIIQLFGEVYREPVESIIKDNPYADNGFLIKKVVAEILPPEIRMRFLEPPVDLRKSFEESPGIASANLGGISQMAHGKLFTDVRAWNDCVTEEVEHPFMRDDICVSVKGSEEVKDFLKKPLIINGTAIRHPGLPRFVHIDQSRTGDRTGTACCHLRNFEYDSDGLAYPVVEIDFLLEISPPKKPDEISISKIQNFYYQMHQSGMTLGMLSYDQYASDQALQFFMANNIPCSRQSMDRNDAPWIEVNRLLKAGRIFMYEYTPLRNSYFGLDHDRDKRKVDHVPEVFKDISDAFVGAVNNCISYYTEHGDSGQDVDDLVDAYGDGGGDFEATRIDMIVNDWAKGKEI